MNTEIMIFISSILNRLGGWSEKVWILRQPPGVIKRVFILAFLWNCYGVILAQTPSPENILFVQKGAMGNGSSWANAIGELSEALTWAGGNWDVDADGPLQIWVASGKYLPTTGMTDRDATFQLINGVAVYGGFAGTETLLTERDWTSNITILSGDIDGDDESIVVTDPDREIKGGNSYSVVTGSGTNSTAVLDGFIITAGSADQTNSEIRDPSGSGGGVYNDEGSPRLINITITGNKANHGGGIYNHQSFPTLTHVTISYNIAASGYGNGIYNDTDSKPYLSNVIISGKWESDFGDYAITFIDEDYSPHLTVVADSEQSKRYQEADPVLTFTASGFINGDNAAAVIDGALTRVTGEEVGTYPIIKGTLSALNYTMSFIGSDFNIDKALQEIDFNVPERVLLNENMLTLTASASSGLPVQFSVDNATMIATLSGNALNLHRSGKVIVNATQEGNNNYEAALPVSKEIEIMETPSENSLSLRKALSPNGDGINDVLIIHGIEAYPDNRMVIFDQGGNILADIESYDNERNVFTGAGVQNGTYYYRLYIRENGKQQRFQGFFEIKR